MKPRKSLSFLLRTACFAVLGFFSCATAFSQVACSEIYTDYGGYWKSTSASPSATKPNSSHNVLGFKVGTTIYSTGVNNANLTSHGIAYTSTNFQALPLNTINGTTTGAPLYMALASTYDGNAAGYSTPLPTVKMKDVLTDGTNGLNIGTGITNVPNTCAMSYSVQSITTAAITDAIPDFLFTQIADPSGSSDQLYFINSAGATVGSVVTITWTSISSLGDYYLDLYNLQNGVSCNTASIISGASANTTREIRMATLRLTNFGITAANAASVAALVVIPGGQSDPAFVAYNTASFTVTTPVISSNPASTVACPNAGQNATFTVSATGYGLTYQWRKNGVNIAGATSSSYTITNVTAADAGPYDVIVTNSVGSATSNTAYLNVTIVTQPSPATQSIVTGNSVTLTVTATNTTSYQWKKDGVNISGATSSSLTINPFTSADNGSYSVLAINSAGSGCASINSTAAAVSPAVVLYSLSTGNLNDPTTWGLNTDGSGSRPVDFTRSEHTFVISNRATATTNGDWTVAGTVDVSNTATTIAAGSTLDVGALIRSGTGSLLGTHTSNLTLRGTSNLYFASGSQVIKNLTITAGTVTMLSPLSITATNTSGKLSLTGGTFALNGNKVTLKSSSTLYTAMVTAVGASASITYGTGGGFVVERYVPSHRAFRFITPAVTSTGTVRDNWMEGVNNMNTSHWPDPYPGYGTHITGPGSSVNGFDATNTNNPSMFTFNSATQTWATIPNTSVMLQVGKGYRLMVRGSRAVDLSNNAAAPSTTILRTTGTLTTGTVSLNSSNLATASGKFCFIGNPYACPISWSTLQRSGVSSSYYTWDQSVGGRGAYVSYNSVTGLSSNGSSAVNDNIQSEQAFFVLTTSATPTLQFRESDKTLTNTAVFRGANNAAKLAVRLLLNTKGENGSTADGFVALFDDAYADSVGDEDSYKFTNLDENMGIDRNGTLLSIEARKAVAAHDTLPLKLWQFRQNDYHFELEASNFDPAVKCYVHDTYLQTNTQFDPAGKTLVPFSITTDSGSFAPDRFYIVFSAGGILPIDDTRLSAVVKGKGVQLNWRTTIASIEHFEVEKSEDGVVFNKEATVEARSNAVAPASYDWFDDEPFPGVNFYRVKCITQQGQVKYTDVAKVITAGGGTIITVAPNPVKNNSLKLWIINGAEGKYPLQLFNSAGQQVLAKVIEHDGGSSSYTIRADKKLVKGIYHLQVNCKGRLFTQQVLFE